MGIEKTKLIRQLEDLLDEYDPDYYFSDDYRVWSKNQEINNEISAVVKLLGKQGQKIYRHALERRGIKFN